MDAVRTASYEEIENCIKSGGLAKKKAKTIKDFLSEVHFRYGETNLEFLHERPSDEVKEILLSFKGIGPKTVACMMLFTMGRPEFAVVRSFGNTTKIKGYTCSQTYKQTRMGRHRL